MKFVLRICLTKKDKQWSAKHYTGNYKWDRTIPIETVDALICSIQIFNSCSTSDTCYLNDMLSVNKTFDTNVENCCMFFFKTKLMTIPQFKAFLIGVNVMVFNATFNNMSWRSVLLVRKPECRQVTPLRHIIHNPSQPVFAFTPV